jgi:hypothetical protein
LNATTQTQIWTPQVLFDELQGSLVRDTLNSRHGASRPAQLGHINYWAWLVGAPAAVLVMMLVSRL